MAGEDTRLKGLIGGQAAGKLAKHRGIETVGQLLDFWPRRYRTAEADLGQPRIGDFLVAVARVESAQTRSMKSRRGRMLEATITDGRSRMRVTFFDARGHERKLVAGQEFLFAGSVTEYRGVRQLAHPGYATLEEAAALGELGDVDHRGLIPIYRHVPGVHPWTITRCVRLVLGQLDEVTDAIPEPVRSRRDLLDRAAALRAVHAPRTHDDVDAGRRRLRYEEALVLQCLLGQRRVAASRVATEGRQQREGGLLSAFDERLPFELTEGQRRVSGEILDELARPTPMHRLLQGEVGSGKTVVALRAMLAAVDAGGQAVLLAPTEVLAAQHEASIRRMLGDLAEGGMLGGDEHATRVALLTGSMSTARRREALLEIASGDAGIVVGTHALLEDRVSFRDLALVVVDEQHRFGVEQRDALRAKGTTPPHLLVMTATPIPRTVAMTVFGDMETSTLRELPRGRAPITTHLVPTGRPDWVDRTWQRVAEEVAAGRQAYVVCPRIGDDDGEGDLEEGLDLVAEEGVVDDEQDDGERVEDGGAHERPLAGVVGTIDVLREHPALQGLRIEMLHGRMTPEDKDAVMARYTAGEIDVLVSTTVIEVGVDVPNASTMVILDADRFGVSQLHQLRGRVGRGGDPGICLLMTATETESALERLEAVAGTTDGFELARLDLTQRREGDVLGSAQHGARTHLQHLSVLRDEDLIEAAREDAGELLTEDPDLGAHPALRDRIADWLDAERAAYLEKG
ncbi:ATP-dependent DNA helicase RecG [Janibacter cremeus]|uniref:ATP-dependent DNA helicase RecG n=1 Tax=Janibacter cremeus TaxID=1285192 RepID=UPI0023FA15F3|nr:ATP-dependent DNA helicase RecG [Janibacter cremeus]WEV78450.1 ATP-dependent DNA helicase RecG [Janibacter cremeus]